jgi:hypothetical protein
MYFEQEEDLNKAKKKILNLLKMKYNDDVSDYVESDDLGADEEMEKIIKLLSDTNGYLFQMLTATKKEKDTINEDYTVTEEPDLNKDGTQKLDKKGNLKTKTVSRTVETISYGNLYFRSMSSYQSFMQQIFNAVRNMKQVNTIFSKIINNIGYVEPETMREYEEIVDQYYTYYNSMVDVTTRDGEFKVTIKDKTNVYEKLNLSNEFSHIGIYTAELKKYEKIVDQTYNYKNVNVVTKRTKKYISNNDNKMTNYDEDEK